MTLATVVHSIIMSAFDTPSNICILQRHPYSSARHFCHALADAYADGATEAGHSVSRFDVGALEIPILRDPAEFATPAPEPVRQVQQAVLQANHLMVVYPLWLETMPALVKAFFEHFARAQFAIEQTEKGWPRKMLKGRSDWRCRRGRCKGARKKAADHERAWQVR